MKNHLLLILTAFTILLSCNNKKPDEGKSSKTNEQDSLTVSAASRAVMDRVRKGVELFNKEGEKAFDTFRVSGSQWRSGDDYIFVFDTDGNMLVHTDTALEGKNVMDLKDLKGNSLVKDEIALAMKQGKGWIDGYWYKPGDNKPALKRTFVRKVNCDGKTCIIGSGYYPE